MPGTVIFHVYPFSKFGTCDNRAKGTRVYQLGSATLNNRDLCSSVVDLLYAVCVPVCARAGAYVCVRARARVCVRVFT